MGQHHAAGPRPWPTKAYRSAGSRTWLRTHAGVGGSAENGAQSHLIPDERQRDWRPQLQFLALDGSSGLPCLCEAITADQGEQPDSPCCLISWLKRSTVPGSQTQH